MIVNPFAGSTSTQMDAIRDVAASFEQAPVLEDLASFVKTQFQRARDHRRKIGVDDAIAYANSAVKMRYTPEDVAKFGEAAVIYMGVTNIKVRAATSWLKDILANADEQPWALKATPSPELPASATEIVLDRLAQHVQQFGFDVTLPDKAAKLKSIAQRFINKIASEAAGRMETTLRDQLVEGGWRTAFDEFGKDLMMYPAAVLKGPFLRREPSLRWDGAELRVVDRIKRRVERVDPIDIFPAPNATCTQSGAYLIQRMRVGDDYLLDLIGTPGFSEAAVRTVLATYETGVREDALGASDGDDDHGTDGSALPPDQRYEIHAYYGKVSAELLQSHGIAQEIDPQLRCEAEVWVCGGLVLKAILNPHPLGRRPFHSAAFEAISGAFWGQSLPEILEPLQRGANAAARSLVRNMAFSAGPVGEYDVDRLANEEDVTEVEPFRLYAVDNTGTPGGGAQPAFRWQVIPSVARELMDVHHFYSKLADDYSGIPAYVLGNPQVAGAGRTLGGLSMLMGNAAKGIKAVINNVDRGVIEPLLTDMYVLEMMFGEDPTTKVDAAIVARGSAGILQRELSQARAVDVLQVLTPFATGERPIVKPPGIKTVIRSLVQSLGFSPDDLVDDPDEEGQLRTMLEQLGLPVTPGGAPEAAPVGGATPAVPSAAPGTPLPQLDRRSTPPVSPDQRDVLRG